MAVYTHIDTRALAGFLQQYALAPIDRYRGIDQGISNTNYQLFFKDNSRLILTLYEHERRIAVRDIPFFLDLMRHLSRHGIPCPVPITTRQGETHAHLCGKHAALTSFLDGHPITHVTERHCWDIGYHLACLHNVGMSFTQQRHNPFSLQGWRALRETLDPSTPHIPMIDETLTIWEQRHDDIIALPQGIIHGDIFPDNVFFQRDKLSGIIDFYFACTDSLAYDIAIAINAWCFPSPQDMPQDMNVRYVACLLNGYEQQRPLQDKEKHAMPLLCQGAALSFLLSRLIDEQQFDTPLPHKNPQEYADKLSYHRQNPHPLSITHQSTL
ncbi:MAG: homoserine kinase [Alphaproteobacteria bacterium GM7ARS4]|nr:homoserine kinase [Alphaproteobacteria bacterium GM7ARS4]